MNVPLDDATLGRIRAQLPATQHVAYLNAGTLGPLPQRAIDAMDAEHEYDIGIRQDAHHWDRLLQLQDAARSALGTLTGVSSEQVALMHSTHEGLNACVWGLDLRSGDVIVTSDEEHPGLLVPLRHVRARLDVEVRIASWMDDDDAFVDSILACVDERTRAVAISHVSWVSGRIAPLSALRAALPENVRVIVDGAQSAGIIPVDPVGGWDAYTVSGQKWPCGPNGSGCVALADPEAWLPTAGAYMQVTDHADILSSGIVADGRRLEQSQESLGPLAGIAASLTWLMNDVGVARAHAHARHLNERMRGPLTAGGISAGSLHGFDHLLAIDMPRDDAPAIAGRLLDAGLLTRPLDTGRLRVSFGCWNTEAEIDQLTSLLVEALVERR
jgi:L-cysteine/cystine lyase